MKHVAFTALGLAALSPAAWAQGTSGTLIPTDGGPPLEIASQEVDIHINNGIVVTSVTQVFRNNRPEPREAVYSFPVPDRASVSNFSMWIDGREIVGEVLEKKRAREIYESITRQRRDPGLLEQTSYKLFEMRVFPVPASGTQKVRIAWYQPVDFDAGFATYVYPLEARTREFSRVAGTLKIDVDVASEIPLKRVWSPSHTDAVAVAETAAGRWRASLEQPRGRIDRDFVVVYELARERTALSLVPFAKAGEDGYFMLVLTAGADLDRVKAPMHFVFVVDVSGSMGEQHKLDMAVRATRHVLASLGPDDTFNIVIFNISASSFRDGPAPAREREMAEAEAFLRRLQPSGGTDLVPALEHAASRLRPDAENVVVLLSDGNASEGDDHSRFGRLLATHATAARIFSFGLGNEVNRPLLGVLADRSGGYADFISSGDEVERKAGLLMTKMKHRVAEDLVLWFEGAKVHDVAPARFPNLFRGSQAVAYGRYTGSGKATVVVEGRIGAARKRIAADVDFPAVQPDHPEVRRMWAWHRTDELMRDVRLNGERPDVVRQVVDLGCRHSIITPYTSFLVLESEDQYRQFGIERRNAQTAQEDRSAQQRRSASRPADSTARGGGGGGGGGSVELGLIALVAAFAVLKKAR